MSGSTLLVLIVVGVLVAVLLGAYNSLIALKTQVDRAWANIDVLLKQRFDEIPQLIEVIEQYAQYESALIEKVVEARQGYVGAKTPRDKMNATQEMSLALGGVLALGEAYPELKANDNFKQLQTRISSIEESLSDRRETYNEYVANFNARIAQIPYVLFAGILGYGAMDMFQVSETERQRPNLKMNLGIKRASGEKD